MYIIIGSPMPSHILTLTTALPIDNSMTNLQAKEI
jgi:hypothetical protein